MKLAPEQTDRVGDGYVCPACDEDPLHDPVALKWVDSPLRLPAK